MVPAAILAKASVFLQTAETILAAPKVIEGVIGSFENSYHSLLHGGKKEYGSVYLRDSRGVAWKVKVRWRGDRGHYLKFKPVNKGESEKFRAAVGRKHFEKPWKYRELAPDEWKVFALCTMGDANWNGLPSDIDPSTLCREILDDLTRRRS